MTSLNNEGTSMVSEKYKDKIMSFNSEIESGGDADYRRFSQYNKEESKRMVSPKNPDFQKENEEDLENCKIKLKMSL